MGGSLKRSLGLSLGGSLGWSLGGNEFKVAGQALATILRERGHVHRFAEMNVGWGHSSSVIRRCTLMPATRIRITVWAVNLFFNMKIK